MSVVRSYAQCTNALKHDIFTAVKQKKSVVAHVSKISAVVSGINDFYQAILKIPPKNIPATKEDDEMYNALTSEITVLKQLFESLTEKQFVQTVASHKLSYVNDAIQNFKKAFNQYTVSLSLSVSPPLQTNTSQDIIDDKTDCIELRNMLMEYTTQSTVQTMITLLSKQIEVLDAQSQILQKDQQKTTHPLTSEEVVEELKEYKDYFLQQDSFEMIKKIGGGVTSCVYQGLEQSSGKFVAIKKLNISSFTKKTIDLFKREISILIKTKHFAFPPFIGFTASEPFCIVTDFMAGDTLFQRLHVSKLTLSPTKRTIIALGIAYGLAYLHNENVIHRDLKSLNVLLDSDDLPHVCDFGASRLIPSDGRMTHKIGTLQWMAPEILSDQNYSLKADVYSYGIILYELLTKEIPWKNLTESQMTLAVVKDNKRPELPSDAPSKLVSFIKKCWDSNPENRPTFASIVAHIESGDLCFPDTNIDEIEAYKAKFASSLEIQINTFDISEIDEERFYTLFKKLIFHNEEDKQIKGIQLARKVIAISQWTSTISLFSLLEQIEQSLSSCRNPKIAKELFLLVSEALQITKIQNLVGEFHLSKLSVSLFESIGDTSMISIVYILIISLKLEKERPSFSSDILLMIGSFLGDPNIDLSKDTFTLLAYIYHESLYENKESFTTIIPNIFSKLIPSASNQLLDSLLDLLLEFCSNDTLVFQMNKIEGAMVILDLCQRSSIADKAMSLLINLCTASQPSPSFSVRFIHTMSKLFSVFSNESMIRPLILLSTIMSIPSTYKEIGDDVSAIRSLEMFLTKGDNKTHLLALKLCFSFLENEHSSSKLFKFQPIFIKLLFSEDEDVTILAASCLIITLGSDSSVTDITLSNFINSAFKKSHDSQIVAIKLIGIIAQTFNGAKMLQKANCISPLCEAFCQAKDRDFHYFSLAAITVLSAALSYTNEMGSSIPHLFEISPEERAYSLIPGFIYNICISPFGAAKMAPFYPRIIEETIIQVKSSTSLYLASLEKIVTAPEALELIREKDLFGKTQKLISLSTKGYLSQVMTIISSVVDYPEGKEAVASAELNGIIISSIQNIPQSHPLRPILIKLKSILIE